LEEICEKHVRGHSLLELSEIYKIPQTTLNRYLANAGYKIYFNCYRCRLASWQKRQRIEEFVCPNAWKRALLENMEHKCYICGYDKIVKAHTSLHSQIMESTRENSILLCPNHHAEAHAGLLNIEALIKINKLALEKDVMLSKFVISKQDRRK